MYKDLDPILHSQLRLAIVSILMGVEQAEFVYLKEQTKATAGNLSIQIENLSKAGYIKVIKGFKGKYPVTTCRITAKGTQAFEKYVRSLKGYLRMEQ